ncbi:MAG: bis(5'-nucleosyl)-tetraphosphatase (symmetrical) YqeK [Clostridia bacterium]|nr:bis(5'-nucleosyl)-tetraphosphatase (symmetrical) YqeK [Clostridia bacterium]
MNAAHFEEIKERVRSLQSEKRFRHTLSVVREAEYIAKMCAFSEAETEKARLAALLHDITKCFSDTEQAEMFEKYGITEQSEPPTAHEKTGAYFARELFGDDIDSDVFSAISCHTTGKAGMSALDMAIFIADFTEETREHASCRYMRAYLHTECERICAERKKAEELLRDVTQRIIENTLGFLTLRKRKIDLHTVEAWNFLAE